MNSYQSNNILSHRSNLSKSQRKLISVLSKSKSKSKDPRSFRANSSLYLKSHQKPLQRSVFHKSSTNIYLDQGVQRDQRNRVHEHEQSNPHTAFRYGKKSLKQFNVSFHISSLEFSNGQRKGRSTYRCARAFLTLRKFISINLEKGKIYFDSAPISNCLAVFDSQIVCDRMIFESHFDNRYRERIFQSKIVTVGIEFSTDQERYVKFGEAKIDLGHILNEGVAEALCYRDVTANEGLHKSYMLDSCHDKTARINIKVDVLPVSQIVESSLSIQVPQVLHKNHIKKKFNFGSSRREENQFEPFHTHQLTQPREIATERHRPNLSTYSHFKESHQNFAAEDGSDTNSQHSFSMKPESEEIQFESHSDATIENVNCTEIRNRPSLKHNQYTPRAVQNINSLYHSQASQITQKTNRTSPYYLQTNEQVYDFYQQQKSAYPEPSKRKIEHQREKGDLIHPRAQEKLCVTKILEQLEESRKQNERFWDRMQECTETIEQQCSLINSYNQQLQRLQKQNDIMAQQMNLFSKEYISEPKNGYSFSEVANQHSNLFQTFEPRSNQEEYQRREIYQEQFLEMEAKMQKLQETVKNLENQLELRNSKVIEISTEKDTYAMQSEKYKQEMTESQQKVISMEAEFSEKMQQTLQDYEKKVNGLKKNKAERQEHLKSEIKKYQELYMQTQREKNTLMIEMDNKISEVNSNCDQGDRSVSCQQNPSMTGTEIQSMKEQIAHVEGMFKQSEAKREKLQQNNNELTDELDLVNEEVLILVEEIEKLRMKAESQELEQELQLTKSELINTKNQLEQVQFLLKNAEERVAEYDQDRRKKDFEESIRQALEGEYQQKLLEYNTQLAAAQEAAEHLNAKIQNLKEQCQDSQEQNCYQRNQNLVLEDSLELLNREMEQKSSLLRKFQQQNEFLTQQLSALTEKSVHAKEEETKLNEFVTELNKKGSNSNLLDLNTVSEINVKVQNLQKEKEALQLKVDTVEQQLETTRKQYQKQRATFKYQQSNQIQQKEHALKQAQVLVQKLKKDYSKLKNETDAEITEMNKLLSSNDSHSQAVILDLSQENTQLKRELRQFKGKSSSDHEELSAKHENEVSSLLLQSQNLRAELAQMKVQNRNQVCSVQSLGEQSLRLMNQVLETITNIINSNSSLFIDNGKRLTLDESQPYDGAGWVERIHSVAQKILQYLFQFAQLGERLQQQQQYKRNQTEENSGFRSNKQMKNIVSRSRNSSTSSLRKNSDQINGRSFYSSRVRKSLKTGLGFDVSRQHSQRQRSVSAKSVDSQKINKLESELRKSRVSHKKDEEEINKLSSKLGDKVCKIHRLQNDLTQKERLIHELKMSKMILKNQLEGEHEHGQELIRKIEEYEQEKVAEREFKRQERIQSEMIRRQNESYIRQAELAQGSSTLPFRRQNLGVANHIVNRHRTL